jgi:hypothetical protein
LKSFDGDVGFPELGTLVIAPLIFHGRGIAAIKASWKYLMFSVVGLGLNLIGLRFRSAMGVLTAII